MKQLQEKHPEAQKTQLRTLAFGPTEQVLDSIFQQVNGEVVREAALKTKGSGGPSGVDSNGFRRMMACKSFKSQAQTSLPLLLLRREGYALSMWTLAALKQF